MSNHGRDPGHAGKTLHGIVKELNLAPKGEIDGLLLDVDGEIVQVNLPPDRSDDAAQLVGKAVDLIVGPEPKVTEHPGGDHPVHRLVAFQGESSPVEGLKPGHKPPHAGHGHGEPVEVRGTVVRLNYAKHGEANGVLLDVGDFLHLKPHGMKMAGLTIGQEVTAKGKAKPARSGGRAIEAEVVNGRALPPKKPH